ncbi:TPA: hypothetical protein N3G02_005559, partial [Salmonella enterica subsp. enterica serovar Newport]|nr:hypothetical protein [Salmonella enterica subsp. enterica serovar Newport]HCM3243980.1 hypothetical protein [Salmonella enterica subsp. enterica serovar Newport]
MNTTETGGQTTSTPGMKPVKRGKGKPELKAIEGGKSGRAKGKAGTKGREPMKPYIAVEEG